MSKKVLVIYYSQSGQLKEIADQFAAPFREAGVSVENVSARPKKPFDFPWDGPRFFDAMPESVLGVPVEMEPLNLQSDTYDLIVFGYQPWYLSPSIPATSLLLHPDLIRVLRNTPVITLIGSRNMWLNAQERIKKLLTDAGARLVGNVALADRNSNLVSAVTIVHWMMSGRKDRYLGIFPRPGIHDEDIRHTSTFGAVAFDHLQSGNWETLQKALLEKGAVTVHSNLMFIESKAERLFLIWANLIIKKKSRAKWLVVFKYYLAIALFILSPIIVGIYSIFFKPFSGSSILKRKQYYSGVNLIPR
jgi:hypothetical protein